MSDEADKAYERGLRMAAHAINIIKPDFLNKDGTVNHFHSLQLAQWFDCRQAVLNLLTTKEKT